MGMPPNLREATRQASRFSRSATPKQFRRRHDDRVRHSLRCFLVALLGALTAPAQTQLRVTGLPAEAPLKVKATATASELSIDLVIDTGWHLYSRDTGGGQPVSIQITEGSAFRATGPLQTPPSADGRITGTAKLSLPIERRTEGTELETVMQFMACDPVMCLPPMECLISGTVAAASAPSAISVLLVVREQGDRSERIASFLGDHGHTCTTTTYEDVTAALCNQHQVVLADSELFGTARAATRTVWTFPRTESPVVAVGFLGTELVEKHDLAMTSGYI